MPHWNDLPLAVRQARQQSNIRISELEGEVIRAIGVVLDKHPDALTYEEVCVALNEVMARQLRHLLNDAPEDGGNDG